MRGYPRFRGSCIYHHSKISEIRIGDCANEIDGLRIFSLQRKTNLPIGHRREAQAGLGLCFHPQISAECVHLLGDVICHDPLRDLKIYAALCPNGQRDRLRLGGHSDGETVPGPNWGGEATGGKSQGLRPGWAGSLNATALKIIVCTPIQILCTIFGLIQKSIGRGQVVDHL